MNEVKKTTAGSTERRAFTMDKAILWTVIQGQAGSLSKALLELIMNSADAGGTKVDITIDAKSVTIVDDGKGFASRSEIENFFERFGTPHKPGDAIFGTWRMGRGMIFSFTRNTWRSGKFKMFVDIKELGLEYDLTETEDDFKGCQITGVLYEPLVASSLLRLIDELRALCKYSPIPVRVNGEVISKDLSKVKWTHQDDDAYYLIKDSSRSLEVFNLGVFVREYWRGEAGTCGLVVSKKQLALNTARNDVLMAKCDVYKRIVTKLKSFAKLDVAEKPRNNEAAREMELDRLITGAYDSLEEFREACGDAKVFTDYSGRHFSVQGLAHATHSGSMSIAVAEDYSGKADRVHATKLAIVISPKTMARVKGLSFEEILERIAATADVFEVPGAYANAGRAVKTIQSALVPLSVVGSMIDESRLVIEPREYSKEERLVLSVLARMSGSFSRATRQEGVRRLGVFESESLNGYTDGSTVVFLNRKFLKVGGAAGNIPMAFDSLKGLLLHEYLHDVEDSTGHGHPAEFYERFHEIMRHDHGMQRFTYDASMLFLSMRRKSGAKMRTGDLKTLDMVLVEDDEPISPTPAIEEEQARDSSGAAGSIGIEEPIVSFDSNGMELDVKT